MLRPTYLIAFSGHRPEEVKGRSETDLAACTPRLRKTLIALQTKAAAGDSEIHLVSSLAAGADIIACETAIELGIPIHLVLPKPEIAFLQTFHHEEPTKDFSAWLPRALAILATIRPDPNLPHLPVNPRHTLRMGAISTSSPECYAEANSRILEAADLLLTISNGAPSKSIAGTTHLISQAAAIGIPLLNLNPADPPSTDLPAIPVTFAAPDCPSLEPFRRSSPHLTCDLGSVDSPFRALANCLSTSAGHSAKWYRRASALAIGSHALATILAAAAASFYYSLKKGYLGFSESEAYWILAFIAAIEVILVFCGWYLERRLHHDKAQETWLHCRFARELMRGMEKSISFLDPLYPEIRRHKPEWRRFALTVGLMLREERKLSANPGPEEVTQWKDQYVTGRVKDQEKFFTDKVREASRPKRFFHFVTHRAGFVALLCVLFACGVKLFEAFSYEPGYKPVKLGGYWLTATVLLFLPILMPLLASIGASFGAVFDYERRAARYHDIAASLSRTARILPTLNTLPEISTAVRLTEETLLGELIEWFAAQRKGLGH